MCWAWGAARSPTAPPFPQARRTGLPTWDARAGERRGAQLCVRPTRQTHLATAAPAEPATSNQQLAVSSTLAGSALTSVTGDGPAIQPSTAASCCFATPHALKGSKARLMPGTPTDKPAFNSCHHSEAGWQLWLKPQTCLWLTAASPAWQYPQPMAQCVLWLSFATHLRCAGSRLCPAPPGRPSWPGC